MSPLRRCFRSIADAHPTLVVVVLFAYLTLLGGGLLYVVLETRTSTTENHQALCAVRADLDRRIKSSRDFLHDHPNGFPGVPRASIVISIHNAETTRDALKSVTCP